MYSKTEKSFLRVNLITIISLFFLILAGGVVRSSGSGMGCPDWPKCFDHYIPPTDVSGLPVDYKEKYVTQRLIKNERFAKLLDKSGYADLAIKVRNDKSIKIPEEFNAVKTYTEYINRLIGALTGLLLLSTFILSIRLLKVRKRVFWLSGINLLLVLFQAWLGSIVVSTNLMAWIITVHMLVAILILAVTIYTYFDIKNYRNADFNNNKVYIGMKIFMLLITILSIIQITVGTEVREEVDAVQSRFTELNRGEWLNEVGQVFTQHKELAMILLISNGLLFFLLKRGNNYNIKTVLYGKYIIFLLLFQILTGLILSNFSLTPWGQAPHILLATLMFSAQFYLLLILFKKPLLINNN
ncbi:cytochrome oxidase assembly protein [Pedobacter psychrophilus]|uniref:Cytochrome oxidase assembly protein n=1 Tax=Pedobacter psychrophilus TaxID=1826909 RepID=A0A179DKW5_9SPHI|nr:COX15/CtaA family protein [Pedobacter psychrophilus]OAQ41661.1 cytochrome oxidase assembly protein [Pedobacter psychrophilus]